VGSATSELSDRATSFLNETTARFEREYGRGRSDRDLYDGDLYDPEDTGERDREGTAAQRMAARRKSRYQAERMSGRTPRLYRDPEHQKIGGVCAGIARYYGMEIWVVRCIAVTGLLFFPSLVMPAYWIMYFVMDKPPGRDSSKRAGSRSKRSHRRSWGQGNRTFDQAASGADEIGPPRYRLRNVQADFAEVELRLRRMESHVTSGQFELQRELHRIEAEEPAIPEGTAAMNGNPGGSPGR
jgi:phage shock protein C